MAFYIRGTRVREPARDGIQITDEPVWGENTMRDVNTGTMMGDIKTYKKTVAVTWPPLTFAEADQILQLLKGPSGASPFYKIKYNDSSANTEDEITVYNGNLQRTVASISSAYKRQTGVTVTFIEQ